MLVSSGTSKWETVPCLSPSFWWLLEHHGVPWHVDTSFQSLLSVFTLLYSLCVSALSFSVFFIRTISLGLGSILIHYDLFLILNYIYKNPIPKSDHIVNFCVEWIWGRHFPTQYAAAAAKSLQLCPTPCDPIHVSLHPPGSAVPGILQARILEWVAFSFSIQPSIVSNILLCKIQFQMNYRFRCKR